MDNYGGYKLKPRSYSIQPNDIIIRVKYGIPDMPNGQIAIAVGKECLKTYTQKEWDTDYSDWRAIETRPGSEAKVGDTVYCIKHTGGDCQIHDLFIVNDITTNFTKFLGPQQGHTLLNKKITEKDWKWSSDVFVVLIRAEEKKQVQNIVSPEDAKVGDYVIWDSNPLSAMTLGKAYEVVTVRNTSLIIRNNEDKEDLWAKSRFKNIIKDQNQQEQTTTSFIPFTIVDNKGNERTCIGLAEDNWYISINPKGNRVHHNPKFWTKVETTTRTLDSIEKLLNSVASTTPITTASVDSMMNKPTQTKPNLKGKQMNSNLFTDILKLLAQAEQTDLQKAPSTYAFFYNNEGEYEGTARVANEAEAKALLQKPEHLGYTMRIYSFSDEFTTQIPVVSTIKKTVATKPAIKPTRKPKATEVA